MCLHFSLRTSSPFFMFLYGCKFFVALVRSILKYFCFTSVEALTFFFSFDGNIRLNQIGRKFFSLWEREMIDSKNTWRKKFFSSPFFSFWHQMVNMTWAGCGVESSRGRKHRTTHLYTDASHGKSEKDTFAFSLKLYCLLRVNCVPIMCRYNSLYSYHATLDKINVKYFGILISPLTSNFLGCSISFLLFDYQLKHVTSSLLLNWQIFLLWNKHFSPHNNKQQDKAPATHLIHVHQINSCRLLSYFVCRFLAKFN